MLITPFLYFQILAAIFANCIAYAQICLLEAVLANVFGMLYILLIQAVVIVAWTLVATEIIRRLNPPEEMLIIYGSHLATEIVYALTNEKGRNRHERANEKYYAGIRDTMYAPLVKACDRLANYNYAKETHSRMVSCYEKEMEFIANNARKNETKGLDVNKVVEIILKICY